MSKFTIKIERNQTCSDGSTIGRLLVGGQEIGRTLELPWRNNKAGVSRIPEGRYNSKIRSDGKLKWRIELEDVPDREWIQIHIGNYAREIQGCILVGTEVVEQGGECMTINSRATLNSLAEEMAKYSAELGENMSVPISIEVFIT